MKKKKIKGNKLFLYIILNFFTYLNLLYKDSIILKYTYFLVILIIFDIFCCNIKKETMKKI